MTQGYYLDSLPWAQVDRESTFGHDDHLDMNNLLYTPVQFPDGLWPLVYEQPDLPYTPWPECDVQVPTESYCNDARWPLIARYSEPAVQLDTGIAAYSQPEDMYSSTSSGSSPIQPPSPAVLVDYFIPPDLGNIPPTVIDIFNEYHHGGFGPLVPQKAYKPHTLADRKRYVEDVELEAPIMFFLNRPDECGIPLRDALAGKYMRLVGRDDQMFRNRGPSVSIRIRWPGYGNWSRQIPTKDFRSPPGPITRAKLAKNIARTVERFIKEKENVRLDPEEGTEWRVGPRYIGIDDLILVGLQHVSKGSWQAHFRLTRPRT